jgi:outer membrane protein insertion porin family
MLDPALFDDLIESKATESNLPYMFFIMYYREFDKNPSMSKYLQNEFRKGLLKLRDDVPFFDKTIAESDLLSLKNFYEINGFHFASLRYEFKPNPFKTENILSFIIDEGSKYSIDSICYLGLENVDTELSKRIVRFQEMKKGAQFNEVKILNEIKNINNYLRENGYYYSSFIMPKVEIDTIKKTDKVIIEFNTGNRYRIGKIDFIDSTNKQPLIANAMKIKQLEIHSGDWISPKRIESTKDNFLSLGTFELVAIDTTSKFSKQNDSTLNLAVLLFYRKEQEMNFGVSLNQTRMDNFVNLGFETSYRHRNFFGAAQEFSPFANVYLKDLGTVISNQSYEYEAQVGFKYAQPLLWNVGNSRVSFISSFQFSYKLLNNYFKISSFNLPVSFPIKFPKITYFDRASIDFNFLRENPVNYKEAYEKANQTAKTETDSNNILRSFILYKDLFGYISTGPFHVFTSNTVGISLTGDSRNNPFSPTKGYFTFIGLDGWNPIFYLPQVSGLARYLRFQFQHNQYLKLSPTTVLAMKGKFGSIALLEKGNNYVPIDRQFFSGGPNSVRAWPSRQLRYTKFISDSLKNDKVYRFLENFVGNGVIIEGSLELRFGFAKIPGLNKGLQDALQNFKTALFLDFGNSFHWYVDVPDYKVNISDYFTKLALGTGIGLRYETPIGPVRLDFAFPLIDPLKEKKPFSTMQFNFGIGQAF